MARVTSFSNVPPGPLAPTSSPPWPGSMTTVRTAGTSGTGGRGGALAAAPAPGEGGGAGAGRGGGGGLPGREGQGQEVEDEPGRRLLLVGLQLLEPAAERDGEH